MKPLALEQTPLMRVIDDSRRERMRAHVHVRSFEKGEFLYHEGQPADLLWCLAAGSVRTIRSSPSGRVTTLEALHPGDPFGLAAMTDAGDYTESARALSAGQAWVVRRRALAGILDEDPGLSRVLVGIVAERLMGAHDRLCSFAQQNVSERLASTLLEAEAEGRVEATRRTLGEAAGTTVETTIRVLRRFERAGWIEGGVGWIRILDRPALEDVMRGGAES